MNHPAPEMSRYIDHTEDDAAALNDALEQLFAQIQSGGISDELTAKVRELSARQAGALHEPPRDDPWHDRRLYRISR